MVIRRVLLLFLFTFVSTTTFAISDFINDLRLKRIRINAQKEYMEQMKTYAAIELISDFIVRVYGPSYTLDDSMNLSLKISLNPLANHNSFHDYKSSETRNDIIKFDINLDDGSVDSIQINIKSYYLWERVQDINYAKGISLRIQEDENGYLVYRINGEKFIDEKGLLGSGVATRIGSY